MYKKFLKKLICSKKFWIFLNFSKKYFHLKIYKKYILSIFIPKFLQGHFNLKSFRAFFTPNFLLHTSRVRVWHNFSLFQVLAACSLFCTPHPVHCFQLFYFSSNFLTSLSFQRVCDGNKNKKECRECINIVFYFHCDCT